MTVAVASVPGSPSDSSGIVSCKCCDGASVACGTVDFNRSCEDRNGAPPFNASGDSVAYMRCRSCGFLFTTQFDAFSMDDFAARIYNADYVRADPDFLDLRPRANVEWMSSLLPDAKGRRLLDYGGGNGLFSELLRQRGYRAAESYDPFHFGSDARPARRFDIVTAFEVLEHSTTPEATLRDMRWFMADDGLMIFSTLLQPQDVTLRPLDWWYVAPRNGHVSLFSRAALDALMRKLGLKWASFNENTHVAFRRRLPRFAAHFSK